MAVWSNLRCVWNRKWWVSIDSSGDKGSWFLLRSCLPEKRGPTGSAWLVVSQTGRTASALTALSKGRLRTWTITGNTADYIFLGGWRSSDLKLNRNVKCFCRCPSKWSLNLSFRSSLDLFLPTGSHLSICSSPFWLLASTALPLWAFHNMKLSTL